MTVYVYEDADFEKTCKLIDTTTEYGLTGSVFSQDRHAVQRASRLLRNSAGNFYINDKCTGAVVGQQPFGDYPRYQENNLRELTHLQAELALREPTTSRAPCRSSTASVSLLITFIHSFFVANA
jgi:acyl-CoA reductase-like NAD-dependent aldehyde dehydrogenase